MSRRRRTLTPSASACGRIEIAAFEFVIAGLHWGDLLECPQMMISPQTRLESAIAALDVEALRSALRDGADPDQPNVLGQAPLMAVLVAPCPEAEKLQEYDDEAIVARVERVDAMIDVLFAYGANGHVVWRDGKQLGVGAWMQVNREMGDYLDPYVIGTTDTRAGVARVRRWFEHGMDPTFSVTTPDGQGAFKTEDLVDEIAWSGYCVNSDDECVSTPAFESFVHEVLALLVEKGLPAERLLGLDPQYKQEVEGESTTVEMAVAQGEAKNLAKKRADKAAPGGHTPQTRTRSRPRS